MKKNRRVFVMRKLGEERRKEIKGEKQENIYYHADFKNKYKDYGKT